MPEVIVRDFLTKERDPSFQADNVRFRPTDLFDPLATYRVSARTAKMNENQRFNGISYGVQFHDSVAILPPAPTEATAEHKLRALMNFYNTNPVGTQVMDDGNLRWNTEVAYTIEKLTVAEARKLLTSQYGEEEPDAGSDTSSAPSRS